MPRKIADGPGDLDDAVGRRGGNVGDVAPGTPFAKVLAGIDCVVRLDSTRHSTGDGNNS
ncbi:MAG: hypothetical protein HY043_09625 [Verrucomicrobia bacterium]|nr:hypothetical protein [Verrucomicrobiota bacterium]